MQKPKVVVSLNWVGFMELFVERFTLDCQKSREGMNLGQMRHTWLLKVYVRNLKVQMNDTPKENKLLKNASF